MIKLEELKFQILNGYAHYQYNIYYNGEFRGTIATDGEILFDNKSYSSEDFLKYLNLRSFW